MVDVEDGGEALVDESTNELVFTIADPKAGKDKKGLAALGALFGRISEKPRPKDAVEEAMSYYEPILREFYDDYPKRQNDLNQLPQMASRYRSLRSLLDDLTLEPPTSTAELGASAPGDYLTLSTVHSAKGLEWPVVFIIWAMEGYFPSSRSLGKEEDLEEERRLLYVAATRARDELVICYPGMEARPVRYGSDGVEGFRYGGLSSFISDLPAEVLLHGTSRQFGQKRPEPASRGKALRARAGLEGSGMAAGLRLGDRVRHPAFGPGVVSRFRGEDKVEVLFRNAGRKLLHLEYTTLEKI